MPIPLKKFQEYLFDEYPDHYMPRKPGASTILTDKQQSEIMKKEFRMARKISSENTKVYKPVIDAIRSHNQPLTTERISEITGYPLERTREYLDRLELAALVGTKSYRGRTTYFVTAEHLKGFNQTFGTNLRARKK